MNELNNSDKLVKYECPAILGLSMSLFCDGLYTGFWHVRWTFSFKLYLGDFHSNLQCEDQMSRIT